MSSHTYFEKRECQDGSITYYNSEVDECYHSPIGATLEAKEKFVGGIDWNKYAHKEKIVILDVCFGMGYNSAAAIDKIRQVFPKKKIKIIALENDENIVEKGLGELEDFACSKVFTELAKNMSENQSLVKKDGLNITLIIDDAKKQVTHIKDSVDVVFFDPFSPKKAPHMWELEFMKNIFNMCAPGAQLVTYSCARLVRERFAQAGFRVQDGPIVGRRGPATLCTKSS